MRAIAPSLLTALTLAACGASTPRSSLPEGSTVHTMDELRIVASRGEDGSVDFESYDAGQLFEAGTRLVQTGRCREGVERFYDRLVREFPTSRYAPVALYNSAICLQQGGELEASIPYFRQLLELAPDGRDGRHGALQLAQVYVELERWDDALELTERVLLREDLTSAERLEGLARRAQALLGVGRRDDAERQARNALSYYRLQQNGSNAIADPYFAAAVNFVLAESIRQRSEAIPIPAATATAQHEVLDQRAQLLLDAQREYFNTIRLTAPEWSAASGYRIGSMFEQLWQALMQAPIPPPSRELAESTMPIYREEYRAELARHIRPLLRHAIHYWEMTLLLIEQTGLHNEWTQRTRQDLERMRGLVLEQNRDEEREDTSEDPPSVSLEGVLELPLALLELDVSAQSQAILARYGSRLTASGATSK
ncbi:MAG: tetratricopeptide repeat protein [Sandaracinaceae bacterium]